jgi:RimJ/RimL family protein N-acetyltransferase
MKTLQPILADGIQLRLLTQQDLPLTLAWRNRDAVRCWFKHGDMLSMSEHQRWFDQHQSGDDAFMFMVGHIETGVPVGQVSIYNIDRDIGEAEVGRFIAAPAESGKGLMRAAILKLVDFGFRELALKRVFLEVYRDNLRAIQLYESVGFHEIKPDRPTTCGSQRPVVFMEKLAPADNKVTKP